MGLLGKIANSKRKALLEIPESAKKKMRALDDVIIEGYALNLANQIFTFPQTPTSITDIKEFEHLRKTMEECPQALHYVYENGDNIIAFAYKQRKLGAVLLAIQEVTLSHMVEKYGEEEEPLCFTLLKSKNLKALEIMNTFIKKNGLNPLDAKGNKWKDVYASIYAEIKKFEDARTAKFVENIHDVNSNIQDYGREVKQ